MNNKIKLGTTPAQMQRMALDEFFMNNTGLSDVDFSYNPETGEFDIPAIQWDSVYGSYWMQYKSIEARESAKVESYKREQNLLRSAKKAPVEATFSLGDIFKQIRA